MKPIVRRGQNEAEIIRRKLQQHNSRFLTDFAEWCFCMEEHGQILAGIYAVRELDCVTIEYLYVEEKHRGRGYGSQLLERIEQQARAAGAKRIFLNTFSFQAPAFYEKHGYQLFAKLEPAMANYNQKKKKKLLDLE